MSLSNLLDADFVSRIIEVFWTLLPLIITSSLVLVILALTNYLLFRRETSLEATSRITKQLLMVALTATGAIAVVLSLPVGETMRGQLLSLLGIVLSAAIALSSTTLIGNAMAGLMLRAVGNFRPGDFVEVADRLGRVTERGLLHIELQTEDRDLVTLPNLFLVSNPVKVVRSSGTIISATLSLGYDIPHDRVEERLIEAAHAAELQDPYVQLLELGDFSISYRVCGFLSEVKQLLSARTRLRTAILDSLHADGIEIVSPAFVNQRLLDRNQQVIAEPDETAPLKSRTAKPAPEEIVFDKAEAAAAQNDLLEERQELKRKCAELDVELEAAPEGPERGAIKSRRDTARDRIEAIEKALAESDPKLDERARDQSSVP